MIWLIISIVCFLLLRNLTSKLEMDDDDGWVPFKAPLWAWTFAVIICLVPIINIIGLICVGLIAIDDMRSGYPSVRFKEGKSYWLIKLVDFMNKKY